MARAGYAYRTGQALSPADLEQTLVERANENQARRLVLDLTQARSNVALGISGTSIYIADPGGADWELRLSSPTSDPILSSDVSARATLEFRFTELYLTNAAAPSGTAPLILIIGRYA